MNACEMSLNQPQYFMYLYKQQGILGHVLIFVPRLGTRAGQYVFALTLCVDANMDEGACVCPSICPCMRPSVRLCIGPSVTLGSQPLSRQPLVIFLPCWNCELI